MSISSTWPRRIADQRALWKQFARCWHFYLPVLVVYLWALDHIGVNLTPSLPYHVVYIAKHVSVDRGDLIVFRFEGGEIAHHFKGQRFFKRIAGVAGDVITVQGRNVFINGAHAGFARSSTLDGTTLETIEPSVIPADRFYVQGTHEMSFDSRYRVNGLVRSDQIIGKATVIFWGVIMGFDETPFPIRQTKFKRQERQCLALIATVLVLRSIGVSNAEDLGTIGKTYAIAEPHLLNYVEQTLREKEKNGDLARLEEQAKSRVIASITHPKPIGGITPTQTARTFYFDPSVKVAQNITDDKGNIIVPAGTTKNPLEVVSLSKHLLFFDGRDPLQVRSARSLIDHYEGKVKPILVAGSYLDLMKAWQLSVYFDQQGTLTRKMGITHVPALVSQEGMRLRIDELKL